MNWAAVAAPFLYAAGAAAIVWIARRGLGATGPTRWAAVALGCLPLLFVGPALVTGRVYAPFNTAYATEPLSALASTYGLDDTERFPRRDILSDVYSQMLPWRAAVRHAWSLGEWPLWNPFLLAGDPLAGSAQSAPYDPLHLGSLLLPLAASVTPLAGLRFLLHAIGMFALLRRFGCRESIALTGAAAWTFSTFGAFWHAWPLGATLGLLPLVVEGVERLLAKPGLRSSTVLFTALVLAVLAGHPESLTKLAAIGSVWGAARLLSRRFRGPRRRLVTVACAATAGAVAVLATAFFLLPVFDVLTQTSTWALRALSPQLHRAATFEVAARQAVALLAPASEGTPSTWLGQHSLSAYAGSLLWVPCAFGLFRARGRRDLVALCGALAVLGLLLAARAPGVTEAVGAIPLLDRTLTSRFLVLVPFALVVLAGLGLEAWLSAPPTRWWARLHWFVFAAALVLAAIVALRPPEPGVETTRAWTALGWALGPLFAGAFLATRFAGRQGVAFAGFVLLLLAQRRAEMGGFYPALPAAAFYPRPPLVAALPEEGDADPFRVIGEGWAMLPNTSAHWKLEDARGYQPLLHERFHGIEPFWTSKQPAWFGRVDNLDSPWLPLLNVRYAFSSRQGVPAGWREIARSGPEGARLLRSTSALPRAFLPGRVRFVSGLERESAVAELSAAKDFSALAWIEPAAGRVGSWNESRNAHGRLEVEGRGTGYRVTTYLDRPGWFVVSVVNWRGWRAIDAGSGEERPLAFANHAFLGVRVERGRQVTELRYVPSSFRWGVLVSVLTWGGLVVYWAGRRFVP